MYNSSPKILFTFFSQLAVIIHSLLTLINIGQKRFGATYMFDIKEIEKKALSHAERVLAEKRYRRKRVYMFYLLIGVFATASVVLLILYISGIIAPDNAVYIPDGSIPLAEN